MENILQKKVKIVDLYKNNIIIAPRTDAKAVIVNNTTLDKVLENKFDTIITKSDLTVRKDKNVVVIEHANIIESSDVMSPKLIIFDKYGHISDYKPTEPLKINVQNTNIIISNGSEEKELNFGDDFKYEENKLKLTWGNGIT